MYLTAFPLTIELPRPFIVACAVSLAVHAGVAGWYQLNTATRIVQLPRPTLQVKVLSLRERVSITPAPAPPHSEQPLVTMPVPSPVKAENRPEKKSVSRSTPSEPEPKERTDIPLPVQITKKVIDSGPTYRPPSSNSATLNNPKPGYPRIALRRGIEGLVLLHVNVDERGHPIEVKIKKSAGFKPLDIAALKAVRCWRFLPAQRNGVAVRASIEVPIRFRLDSI